MSTLLAIGLANALAAAVLALPAFLVSRSRRRPALAHALWLLVLLKLVTPPLFEVDLPWLPAQPEPAVKVAETTPPPVPGPEPVYDFAEVVIPITDVAPAGADALALPAARPTPPPPVEPVAAAVPVVTPAADAPVETTVPSAPEPTRSDPLSLLLFVWLGGVLLVVGRAVVNVWRFQRLLAFARPAPDDVQAQAREVARGMGLWRCPRVWLVPGPLPPMVWALGRARILFPAGLLDRLDGGARASLLAHELAHVRRRDHWVRWLELVVLGLYWWYPLAWFARRQMQAREEECCDAWASQHSDPRTYATAILDAVDFLAEVKPRLPAAASPLHGVRSLRDRLTLILSDHSPRRLGWLGRATLLAVALAILPLTAGLSRRAESAAPPPPAVEEPKQQEEANQPASKEPAPADAEPTDYNHVVNLLEGSDEAFSVAYSLDGRRIAAGFGNQRRPGMVQVWDAGSYRSLFRLELPRGVSSVDFSHDSKRLAWSGWDGVVRAEDVSTWKKAFEVRLSGNVRLSHSRDGKYLAVAGEDRSLRLLDATSGKLLRNLNAERSALFCVSFSPTSRYLATGGGSFREEDQTGPNVASVIEIEGGKLVARLTGHSLAVTNVAFAPREELIATASADRTVRVYDGKKFALSFTLEGHTDVVKGLAFSPDGKLLATGSWDRTVRLWDPHTGKLLAKLEGHPAAVREVAFSPDGKFLVTGGAMRTVKLWDVAARKEVATLHQDESNLPAAPPSRVLAVSPEGKLLATGTEDGAVVLLDAASGRRVRTLKGHTDVVTALSFSRDGKRLASSSRDSMIKVWDVYFGTAEKELKGHTNWVYSLAISNDGKTLASGGYDRTVRLWSLKDGAELRTLTGHKAAVRALAFSPDDHTLASASSEQISLWDLIGRKKLGVLEGHSAYVRSVLFDRAGRELFSAGDDGLLKRWSVKDLKELGSTRASEAELNQLALSPRGGTLATGGQNGYVSFYGARTLSRRVSRYAHQDGVAGLGFSQDGRVYSLGTGRTLLAWEAVPGPIRLFEGHTGPVRIATFSPDGKHLLSCGGWPQGDGTLRLWDVRKGEQVRLLTTAKASLLSAAFTPDGKHAVAGRDDGLIQMWDVSSGKEVRQFRGHSSAVPHLVFSADGKRLLSSSHDRTLRLWDADTGKEVKAFTGHSDGVRCGAFLPDGKRVVSGGRDQSVRVWDVESGKVLATIDHNKEWVERLAVLPGGKRCLTVGGSAMRLWDLESGKLLRRYGAHNSGITCVAVTKEGDRAMTTGYDGSTRLWDVESGAELRRYGHHRNWVWSVEIAPDGKTFVTAGGGGQRGNEWVAGDDFTIRLWRMGEVQTTGVQTDARYRVSPTRRVEP